MRTFYVTRNYGNDPIGAADLNAEAERIWAEQDPAGLNMEAGVIQVYREDGAPEPEGADYLYCPAVGRLGIAWGADATWADVEDLDSGIDTWLNYPEEWEEAQ